MSTWVKPCIAAGALLLLVAGLYFDLKRILPEKSGDAGPLDGRMIGVTAVVAFVVTGMSGIGGLGVQYWDYYKHNAILDFLIRFRWPVHFSLDGIGGIYLIHSLAYYLLPAAIGKGFGLLAANICAFVFGALGVWLALLWFSLLVGRKSFWVPILFILCSGLDFLGCYIRSGKFPGLIGDPEWWSWPWQYSAHSTLLFFVPHHALPAWIITGLLLYRWSYENDASAVLFWMTVGLAWSTFLFIGWIPWLVFMFFKSRLRGFCSVQNLLCAPLLGVVLGLFYLARGVPEQRGWTFDHYRPYSFIGRYLVFVVMEFMLYAFLTAREALDKNPRLAACWFVALLTLCLLPFYRLGSYNDLVMRASIPSLYIIYVFVVKTLVWEKPLIQKRSLALLFGIGSITAWVHLVDGTRAMSHGRLGWLKGDGNFMLTPEGRNYFGKEDSYFFTHLARN